MGNEVINTIRDFNRFYTAILGVVNNHILESEYSLTEARIIYELSCSGALTAREIKEKLEVDEGYMSRIVARFVKNGLLRKKQLINDKRAYTLELTAKGKKMADIIDQQSNVQVANLIQHLSKTEQQKLAHLIAQVKALLTRK
ncbi:MAG TPA: MarR family winged helix-turn-helix transcriptional regulator [Chitinophaga sp.]|uniref:MarR family winged helix-turn-helix transcriptional regulator n=1 Tax=Chitinophaga sp. TaxID=1869181 RepID=UPI002DBB4708|nr:MarR family winged helix-turn-helix transcriptional regulator [Chitinophaga sp.]HEU4551517.1 MarR family winged helix-turn-helix transcriptional regulator [Chitinophaga sp.]